MAPLDEIWEAIRTPLCKILSEPSEALLLTPIGCETAGGLPMRPMSYPQPPGPPQSRTWGLPIRAMSCPQPPSSPQSTTVDVPTEGPISIEKDWLEFQLVLGPQTKLCPVKGGKLNTSQSGSVAASRAAVGQILSISREAFILRTRYRGIGQGCTARGGRGGGAAAAAASFTGSIMD